MFSFIASIVSPSVKIDSPIACAVYPHSGSSSTIKKISFRFILLSQPPESFSKTLPVLLGQNQDYPTCNATTDMPGVDHAGDQLSASLYQVLLFGFILDVGKDRDIAGQFPDFGKGFNDHQGGLNRLRAFKTSCKTF